MRVRDLQRMFDFDVNGNVAVNNGKKVVLDYADIENVPEGGAGETFSTIAVSGQSNVVAEIAGDTLTLVAGSNITITTDAATDTITIAATGGGSGLTQPQVMARSFCKC